MLIRKYPGSDGLHRSQQGVVLIIVLIVLVAMTMAGIALMRSVNTSTMIAGNLAFRQSTIASADIGMEQAIYWIQANANQLNNTNVAFGYIANIQGNVPKTADGTAWNTYWTTTLDPNPVARPVAVPVLSGNVWTLPTDNAGNTVSYVIHRLCNQDGDPSAAGGATQCSVSVSSNSSNGQSKSAGGGPPLKAIKQVYYRITARIEGPRNTVSYVQTTVSM